MTNYGQHRKGLAVKIRNWLLQHITFNHLEETWRHGKVLQPSTTCEKPIDGLSVAFSPSLLWKKIFWIVLLKILYKRKKKKKKLGPLIRIEKNCLWLESCCECELWGRIAWVGMHSYLAWIKRSRRPNVLLIRESSGGGHGKTGETCFCTCLSPESAGLDK